MTGKRRGIIVAAGLLGGLVLVTGALSQGAHAITRWVVGGGGGVSSASGEVTVDSTLGEPITGHASGGSVSLGAGYNYGQEAEYTTYLPLALRSY